MWKKPGLALSLRTALTCNLTPNCGVQFPFHTNYVCVCLQVTRTKCRDVCTCVCVCVCVCEWESVYVPGLEPRPRRTHRCGTCPPTGTSGSGSIGTCCGSSFGSCSDAHTCRTPASDGWSAGRNPEKGMRGENIVRMWKKKKNTWTPWFRCRKIH